MVRVRVRTRTRASVISPAITLPLKNKVEYRVAADGSVSVFAGKLRVVAPYSDDCFVSTNEIVLRRVKTLFD